MRIARYLIEGRVHYGIVEDERAIARLIGSPFEGIRLSGEKDSYSSARILSPVHLPRVFGAAYNYRAHTLEAGKTSPRAPVLFMKPSTAVIGTGEAIVYPVDGEIVHFEGELGVIIGKPARYVTESDARDFVFGYTCCNDVSDRVVQRRESEFGCLLAGKGYDTFAPLGPVVATDLDPSNLRIITRVNGATRQDGNTADLLFSVPYLISYLSRFVTLLPGDVIMTGTPAGVGPIQIGDVIEVEISGIGVLRNHVVAEVAMPARSPSLKSEVSNATRS